MKQAVGTVFGSAAIIAVIGFALYVASGDGTCQKIERGAKPAIWGAEAINLGLRPWVSPERLESVRTGGLKTQLGIARIAQRYNGDITCPWDAVIPKSSPILPDSLPAIPSLPKRGASK